MKLCIVLIYTIGFSYYIPAAYDTKQLLIFNILRPLYKYENINS